MQLDGEERVGLGTYGPLPLEQDHRRILLAELWAVAKALQIAVAPIRMCRVARQW